MHHRVAARREHEIRRDDVTLNLAAAVTMMETRLANPAIRKGTKGLRGAVKAFARPRKNRLALAACEIGNATDLDQSDARFVSL